MLSRTDETDLLAPLNDGVHESPPWSTFLRRLQRRMRAGSAFLLVHPADEHPRQIVERPCFHAGTAPPRDTIAAILAHRLRSGRVYGEADIGGAIGGCRVVRVDDPEGRSSALLGLVGHPDGFDAADGAVLSRLVPHLAIALRTWGALARARDHGAAADATLARLDGGWLTLAADGRIVDASPAAIARLREAFGPLQPIGERLPLAGRNIGALAAAMAAVAADPAADARLVTLSDQPPLGLLLAPAPAGVAATALGCLRAPRAGPRRAAVIAGLFGLAPTEARLAAAIVEGATLAEAATRLGLTIETVRTYSKRLYAATGTHGQADLVRLILTGIAGFA